MPITLNKPEWIRVLICCRGNALFVQTHTERSRTCVGAESGEENVAPLYYHLWLVPGLPPKRRLSDSVLRRDVASEAV